eukprot:scaffold2924_cov75-Isochrysis_galbana.AAC.2
MSNKKGKRRAEAAALESGSKAEVAAAAPSGLDELDFEDEFEDEFEEEEYDGEDSDGDASDDGADEAGGGAGSSKDAFPDDGVNPSLGGQFYRAGDAMAEGEELQVPSVPAAGPRTPAGSRAAAPASPPPCRRR